MAALGYVVRKIKRALEGLIPISKDYSFDPGWTRPQTAEPSWIRVKEFVWHPVFMGRYYQQAIHPRALERFLINVQWALDLTDAPFQFITDGHSGGDRLIKTMTENPYLSAYRLIGAQWIAEDGGSMAAKSS